MYVISLTTDKYVKVVLNGWTMFFDEKNRENVKRELHFSKFQTQLKDTSQSANSCRKFNI
jgi:hypothetical protein